MMMVLPLLIIVLLPKVVNTNDPEMRKVGNLFSFLFIWKLIFFREVICTISCIFLFIKYLYNFMSTICFLCVAHTCV